MSLRISKSTCSKNELIVEYLISSKGGREIEREKGEKERERERGGGKRKKEEERKRLGCLMI